jgi:hypothetical protein
MIFQRFVTKQPPLDQILTKNNMHHATCIPDTTVASDYRLKIEKARQIELTNIKNKILNSILSLISSRNIWQLLICLRRTRYDDQCLFHGQCWPIICPGTSKHGPTKGPNMGPSWAQTWAYHRPKMDPEWAQTGPRMGPERAQRMLY